jgi:hypothetical protein
LPPAGGTQLAQGIDRMRRGQVDAEPGYDGEYGVIRVFSAKAIGATPRNWRCLLMQETQPNLPGSPNPSNNSELPGRLPAAALPQQPDLFAVTLAGFDTPPAPPILQEQPAPYTPPISSHPTSNLQSPNPSTPTNNPPSSAPMRR